MLQGHGARLSVVLESSKWKEGLLGEWGILLWQRAVPCSVRCLVSDPSDYARLCRLARRYDAPRGVVGGNMFMRDAQHETRLSCFFFSLFFLLLLSFRDAIFGFYASSCNAQPSPCRTHVAVLAPPQSVPAARNIRLVRLSTFLPRRPRRPISPRIFVMCGHGRTGAGSDWGDTEGTWKTSRTASVSNSKDQVQ
jgi:hypothetical protein